MVNEPKSITAAGNLQCLGYAKAITWISEIWDSFDRKILANSFGQCGITSTSIDDFYTQLKTVTQMWRESDVTHTKAAVAMPTMQ